MMLVEYRPRHVPPNSKVRAQAARWSEAPRGLWVTTLDDYPRRLIYVKRINDVWVESDPPA